MPVVIVLAAAVILGGVVVVAMGRGGELSRERPELPAHSDFRSWSDVARYRPPGALLGYHAGATQYALSLIARTIAERDAEIDWLRRRLAEVAGPQAAPDGQGAGEVGLDGSRADSAPGFKTGPADDSALEGNAHVRPTLSLGPRPGEGE